MTRPFFSATAEQVVAATEAIVVNRGKANVEFVANFLDIPKEQAEAALKLAKDIGFLNFSSDLYAVNSPLCRFAITPDLTQKAAVLRTLLESYEPFIVFRERLVATTQASEAAQQTKVVLDLDAHREEIKVTLISLGTYSHALITEGGGRYSPEDTNFENTLEALTHGCRDSAASEAHIRKQIGRDAALIASRDEVIVPLADALIRSKNNDPRGAVVNGGNAVESFLDHLSHRCGVNLAGASGINAKLDVLLRENKLPKKMVYVGKYLGHVRNAADHGVDPEIRAAWAIRPATGVEYIYVACSFISASTSYINGNPPEI